MDINTQIILQVKHYECLYNHNVLEYKTISVRNAAWRNIANELNVSADYAKETWEKLRRCFCNARNRRLSKVNPFRKPWRYEKEMDFLLPFSEIRGSNLNSDEQKKQNKEPDSMKDESIKQEHLTDDEVDEFIVGEEIDENDFTAFNNEHDLSTNSEDFYTTKSIPKKIKLDNELSSTKYVLDNFDETELFFLSMARMVKKLPKQEQSRIKMDISNIVFKAEQKFD
ncbi:unnamed protein product [Brassicogethes aeneus]|uniref:Transcription factor Adf-1 n=1 Tax=Brassicogethes aeneus TaxID=1431903 RepID=A0A9P0FH07_BRAAE|nr:unnamed protein product [Brassicogethes aeneus]